MSIMIDALNSANTALAKAEAKIREMEKMLNPLIEVTANPDGTQSFKRLDCSDCASVEKRAQAARDVIAERLKNCSPAENPNSCEGYCRMWSCSTLRRIRDALKE